MRKKLLTFTSGKIQTRNLEFLVWILPNNFKMQRLQIIRLALRLVEVRNEFKLWYRFFYFFISLFLYILFCLFTSYPCFYLCCMLASSSSKAIGVQVDLHTHLDLSKKLQAIWSSPSDQKSGKSLISKLFVDCSLEFRDLFGWMSINTSTKPTSSLAVKSSDVELQYHMQSCPSPEAAKVSHLYSVLTKITSGMIRLEALLGPLLDLCSVKNVS
ncbi:hypothetical protein Pint_03530 [Pistacia integerrima]|uniref:Uncharacterized protein n=1 Tax=Pistacia integerrima TaxID=434235 RepID=A0ACC0ZNZ7_9ROSI|nr:hypothetical protein Pint_03530 [Pistacia integerrima]